MGEIEKYGGEHAVCILIGNKSDLDSQRTVSIEEGQELADFYRIKFIETSAKSG